MADKNQVARNIQENVLVKGGLDESFMNNDDIKPWYKEYNRKIEQQKYPKESNSSSESSFGL